MNAVPTPAAAAAIRNVTLTTLIEQLLARFEPKAADMRELTAHGGNVPFGMCEDHRTEVLGELLDAIDQAQPGLGTRLQTCLHPLSPSLEEELG